VSPLRRTGPRVRRLRNGAYEVRIPTEEREVLQRLCAELRTLLAADDPALVRLFPPAYQNDEEASREFARLMRDDLTASHLEALRIMEESAGATRVTEEQMSAWLAALNDIRLVLGTRLDVTEDLYERGLPPGDPRVPHFALYQYLGFLQEQVVEAVARGLGAPTRDE
jgi:hypothetical protein